MSKLAILQGRSASTAESRLHRLAQTLGADSVVIPVEGASSMETVLTGELSRAPIACSADLLLDLLPVGELEAKLPPLAERHGSVLIYGWKAEARHDEAIRALSRSEIKSIRPVSSDIGQIEPDVVDRCKQLAASQFQESPNLSAHGFELGAEASLRSLLRRGEFSTLVEAGFGHGKVFLLTDANVIDVHEPASHAGLAGHYDSLLPFFVFLRAALGEWMWTSPLQTSRLIIDDVPLKPHYGALRFDALFHSLGTMEYQATLAFIPWNYWRTTHRNSAYFASREKLLTICVHGCDHTSGEFGTPNEELLSHQGRLGLERMQKHSGRTGIPFENIMVFPQGRFSKKAPGSLRASGYLAAINSTVLPVDNDNDILLGDLLAPAVTRFGGFPVFPRRYPPARLDIWFDLFLGRPAFLVAHHEFFQDGLPTLSQLVSEMKGRCATPLQCLSLSDAVGATVQTRRAPDGGADARVFTDKLRVVNRTNGTSDVRIIKPEPDPDMVRGIAVDGVPKEVQRKEGAIEFVTKLPEGKAAQIEFQLVQTPIRAMTFGPLYSGKIAVRRTLSEFRDEFLSHHPTALRVAKRGLELLK